jgi:hypothetical protein
MSRVDTIWSEACDSEALGPAFGSIWGILSRRMTLGRVWLPVKIGPHSCRTKALANTLSKCGIFSTDDCSSSRLDRENHSLLLDGSFWLQIKLIATLFMSSFNRQDMIFTRQLPSKSWKEAVSSACFSSVVNSTPFGGRLVRISFFSSPSSFHSGCMIHFSNGLRIWMHCRPVPRSGSFSRRRRRRRHRHHDGRFCQFDLSSEGVKSDYDSSNSNIGAMCKYTCQR